MNIKSKLVLAPIICAVATCAHAEGFLGGDQGKLHLTAGFSTVEGAGGGGLTPWALVTGYGSNESYGANVFATEVRLRDTELRTFGTSGGFHDRFELSYAHQEFEFNNGPLDKLGVSLDIVGAKVRLFGDAVYGQDSWIPQVAAGVQFKSHGGIDNFALTSVRQIGARDTKGFDFYLSATNISLASNFLFNVTLRATEANQFGLLGFGGDRHDGYSVRAEATLAYLLTRRLAIGGEFRSRPQNLTLDDEGVAWDAFIAWTPSKHFSVLAAYANVGSVLTPVTGDAAAQAGGYLSLQLGF